MRFPDDVEQKIIEDARRRGQKLPKSIAEAPELMVGLELYFEAFSRLSTCRPGGMSISPIPWLAVDQYCRTFDLDEDQVECMHLNVTAMDRVFLDYHDKKRK